MHTLTSQNEMVVVATSKIAVIRFIDDATYYEEKGWRKQNVTGYFIQVSCDGAHYLNVGHFRDKNIAKNEIMKLHFVLQDDRDYEIPQDSVQEE